MYTRALPYRSAVRLSVHIVLTVLIGLGATIPQAAAHLACSHSCCMAPSMARMHQGSVRIAGPTQPSCCAQQSSDNCRLCSFEDLPLPELAFQTVKSEDSQTAHSIPASRRNLLPDGAMKVADGWRTVAAGLHFPPLYIQTHTLLI